MTARLGVLLPLLLLVLGWSWGCGHRPNQTVDNVLLITLDTTRPDALGPYGNRRVATPVLDRLAREGHVFERAYSHAPITLPSHSSILSGRLPTQHGVRNNIAYSLAPASETLATRLQGAGFATGAFVSSFILDRRFGLNQGFDLYEDQIVHYDQGRSKHEIVTRRAAVTTDLFLTWLERQPGRFFGWVHFYDAHWPYEPPLPFRQAYADQPYLGEIASMDLEIGRIVRFLEDRGQLDNTLIVVTADHGEAFLDHGEQTHGFFCYGATTHVPLILSKPLYGKPGERFEHVVQGIDLAPSLLEALEQPAVGELDGLSLANPRGRQVYAEAMIPAEDFYLAPVHGLRTSDHSFYLSSKTELYDLEADPAETNNLVAEQPELAAEMEQRMRAILDASHEVAPTVHLDQESVALLASLGYVGGGGGFSSRDQDVYRFPSPKESVGMYRELLKVRQFEDSFPFKTIEGLKGLLAEHPRQLVLYRDLGRLATLAGDEATALDSLAKAAHLKPEDPRLHVFRGLGLHRFGHFEESADELKLALKLDPTNANAWYNLGLVEVSRKRMDAAIVAFERAVEHNDRDILALNNLAFLTLTYREDAEAAWVYIERASAINQTQPLVLANRQLIAAARADSTR